MPIKHAFTSAKANGPDATLIQPSNWNENHTITDDLDFPELPSPTNPTGTNIKLYGQRRGRTNLTARTAEGNDITLGSHEGFVDVGLWQPLGSVATAPVSASLTAPTAVGTLTARPVAATNIAERSRRIGYTSAATAGALAGIYWTNAQHFTSSGSQGGFYMVVHFSCSDAVVAARQFIGVSSSVAAPTNVEPNTLVQSIGLAKLSTDNTQFFFVYGGTAAQTAIPLGTAIGAPNDNTTVYRFTLHVPTNSATTVNYQLTNLTTGVNVNNTVTVAPTGAQIPANNTPLAMRAWRSNNATAAAVALNLGRIYIEQRM